jgi:hypothetical protein
LKLHPEGYSFWPIPFLSKPRSGPFGAESYTVYGVVSKRISSRHYRIKFSNFISRKRGIARKGGAFRRNNPAKGSILGGIT